MILLLLIYLLIESLVMGGVKPQPVFPLSTPLHFPILSSDYRIETVFDILIRLLMFGLPRASIE